MNIDQLLQTWKGALAENRFHRIVTLTLAVALAVAAWGLLRQDSVVVLVPPDLREEVWIARDDAQIAYRKSWGLYLAELLGNVAPGSVDLIAGAVEPLLAPAIHARVMEVLHRQAQQIREDRINLRFTPREVLYEPETQKVFIAGYSFVSGALGDEEKRLQRAWEFGIEVAGYAPRVTHIDTYEGKPRTQAELRRGEKTRAER